jgi:hypothetical protein
MSNHPQKSGSLCSGMSGSLYPGIGGSLYPGIGGSLYPGILINLKQTEFKKDPSLIESMIHALYLLEKKTFTRVKPLG